MSSTTSATAAAREFFDVVTGLWDSWADDAFVRDVAERHLSSIPRSCMCSTTRASIFRVRGPLNIARPIQGWPVIVQAGASEAGRQIAAETAEVIFAQLPHAGRGGRRSTPTSRAGWQSSAARRDHMKILPGALVVVGDTVGGGAGEAGAAGQPGASGQRHRLAVDRGSAHDASGFDLDGAAAGDPGDQRQPERAASA